jgi:hypothetical protein
VGGERFVFAMGGQTMADRLKIPRDLGEHRRRLFRRVVREVAEASLMLTNPA